MVPLGWCFLLSGFIFPLQFSRVTLLLLPIHSLEGSISRSFSNLDDLHFLTYQTIFFLVESILLDFFIGDSIFVGESWISSLSSSALSSWMAFCTMEIGCVCLSTSSCRENYQLCYLSSGITISYASFVLFVILITSFFTYFPNFVQLYF